MKLKRNDFLILIAVCLLARGMTLLVPAWDRPAPRELPYDLEKYLQAKGAARSKMLAAQKRRMRLLSRLEELQKKLELESRWNEFKELFDDATLLSDKKYLQLLKVDLTDEEIQIKARVGEGKREATFDDLIQILSQKKKVEIYLLQSPKVSAAVKLAKVRFPIIEIGEMAAGSLILMRREKIEAQLQVPSGRGDEISPLWSRGALGFFFSLILMILQFFGMAIHFVYQNSAFVILLILIGAALVVAGLITGYLRRRY